LLYLTLPSQLLLLSDLMEMCCVMLVIVVRCLTIVVCGCCNWYCWCRLTLLETVIVVVMHCEIWCWRFDIILLLVLVLTFVKVLWYGIVLLLLIGDYIDIIGIVIVIIDGYVGIIIVDIDGIVDDAVMLLLLLLLLMWLVIVIDIIVNWLMMMLTYWWCCIDGWIVVVILRYDVVVRLLRRPVEFSTVTEVGACLLWDEGLWWCWLFIITEEYYSVMMKILSR